MQTSAKHGSTAPSQPLAKRAKTKSKQEQASSSSKMTNKLKPLLLFVIDSGLRCPHRLISRLPHSSPSIEVNAIFKLGERGGELKEEMASIDEAKPRFTWTLLAFVKRSLGRKQQEKELEGLNWKVTN